MIIAIMEIAYKIMQYILYWKEWVLMSIPCIYLFRKIAKCRELQV